MDKPGEHELKVHIATIDQLFNAPDLNPFSEREADVMGEPALVRVVRKQVARGLRSWKGTRLVIILPQDQITPDLQVQVSEAIRRYATAKIDDNKLQIRLSRTRGLLGLVISGLIAAVGILLISFIINNLLASASSTAKGILAGFMSVFTWVLLWDPMEKLLFEWVSPSLESRTLRKMMDLEIVIQPES